MTLIDAPDMRGVRRVILRGGVLATTAASCRPYHDVWRARIRQMQPHRSSSSLRFQAHEPKEASSMSYPSLGISQLPIPLRMDPRLVARPAGLEPATSWFVVTEAWSVPAISTWYSGWFASAKKSLAVCWTNT